MTRFHGSLWESLLLFSHYFPIRRIFCDGTRAMILNAIGVSAPPGVAIAEFVRVRSIQDIKQEQVQPCGYPADEY
jgi:hypothetical protein